jgi:DegV family protein with EDD domain
VIRIVTDSTANVPAPTLEQYGIEVVPLRVIFPDTTYRDHIDISAEEFYQLLPQCTTLPTTSQPPASEFEDAFRRQAADGSEVLAILISGKLSGTVASAVAAQRSLPDLPITVFDSWSVAAPLSLMVQHAAKRAEQGATMAELLRELEIIKSRSQLLFTIDTFKYLQKGGRIGGASALAASLLRIQPILTLTEGVVNAWGKVRGKKKALQTMVEAARENGGTGETVKVGVIHAAALEAAEELANDVVRVLGCARPELMPISPVIGTHVGPGAIGLGYYDERWLS